MKIVEYVNLKIIKRTEVDVPHASILNQNPNHYNVKSPRAVHLIVQETALITITFYVIKMGKLR